MKIFDLKIDGKIYTFVDSIHLNGSNYIAYRDKDSIYISEYTINDEDEVALLPVDDNTINTVKEAMNL